MAATNSSVPSPMFLDKEAFTLFEMAYSEGQVCRFKLTTVHVQ
jgi:hypothetical protein